jgi:uncharacterized protein
LLEPTPITPKPDKSLPHYDRNLNTGHEFGQDTEMRVADQTIFHDRNRPSKIVLPIMPQAVEAVSASE